MPPSPLIDVPSLFYSGAAKHPVSEADAAWMDGEYKAPPLRGLRALARVWAGWGFSQDFYKNEIYRQLGFTSALVSLIDRFVVQLSQVFMPRVFPVGTNC